MINKKLKNTTLWVIIILKVKVYQWMMREHKKDRLEVYLTSYKMQALSFLISLMFTLSFLNMILIFTLKHLGSQSLISLIFKQIKTIRNRYGQRKQQSRLILIKVNLKDQTIESCIYLTHRMLLFKIGITLLNK